MNPETERLDGRPRHLAKDAHFAADRSTTAVVRTVPVITLKPDGRDDPAVAPRSVGFQGFEIRHVTDTFSRVNPVPHQRKTAPTKKAPIDSSIAGWTHLASYTCFFTSAAAAISPGAADQPRLLVHILFGTGSEGTRHGVLGVVAASTLPILLIVVRGVEPEYDIEFTNPADPTDRRTLPANNRWGVGITTAFIEEAITRKFGRLVDYDVAVCAGFSTGYLGLQESIARRLFNIDRLTRVIIFDCLYATLKSPLDRVKALRGSAVQIVCYVVTGKGNSFQDDTNPKMAELTLGGNPQWNYIDLIGNVGFHAVASAHLVGEALTTPKILDALPADYEADFNTLSAKVPARTLVVSDPAVFRRIKGSPPSSAVSLAAFASDPANAPLIRKFFNRFAVTRHCLGRAQLLGWPMPPGEEWHDMLLVEFGWEYLA